MSQEQTIATIVADLEHLWVEKLVQARIINQWESQDEPEHLRTISDRLERNQQQLGRILSIYQQILQGVEVATDNTREQIELKLSGLVISHKGILKLKNPIYQAIFNRLV